MNKLLKGSIAGAAGIALLLGGAGTLAYWNDSATVAGAVSIQTGTLEIESTTAGAWNDDITNIVPGDELEYTEALTITAVGDNLSFAIDTNIQELIAASSFSSVDVDQSVVVTDVEGDVVGDLTDVAAGTYTVAVTVTVDFPFDAANGNQVDQNESLDLSGATVSVTQNTNE